MSRGQNKLFFVALPPNIALQRTVSPLGFLPLSFAVRLLSERAVR